MVCARCLRRRCVLSTIGVPSVVTQQARLDLERESWERGLAAADLSLEVRSPKLLGHTEARKEIRVGDAGRARNNTGS